MQSKFRKSKDNFDPTKPFFTRDGREVFYFKETKIYTGVVDGISYTWRQNGLCLGDIDKLDLYNLDETAPDVPADQDGRTG